uniref:CUB domain-containing protein n=1 Tax=Strongyloides venezuelensis TaxID=75913 RepID=A0A0K0G3T3_STRVS
MVILGSNEILVMLLFFLLTSLDISAKFSLNVKNIEEINNDKLNKPTESLPQLQNDISIITADPKPTKPIYMPLEAISMDVIHHMDQDSECKEFMPGGMSGINEFASPRYPSLYPSNMDCVRIIYAPSGYNIIITFRNIFQIESSYKEILKENNSNQQNFNNTKLNDSQIQDCPNDYLTIRDGRFSFSPLVARLCGSKAPIFNITLHSGFAWLHFHSDSLLQYTGFQATYEFIKTQTSTHIQIPCYFSNIIKYDGFVNSSLITQFYSIHRNNTGPLECVWQFSVPLQDSERLKIAVFVEEFYLADPNDCTSNFVELYQGHVSELPIQRFCGTQVTHTYSNANSVYLKFYAHGKSQVEKLKLLVLYSTYAPYSNCTEHEMFSCGGDICIPKELKCNGRNNCLYQQDEYNCTTHRKIWDKILNSSLASLIMLIICVFLVVLSLCIWYNPLKYYYRRSKKQSSNNFGSQKNLDIFATDISNDFTVTHSSQQKRSSNSNQSITNSMFALNSRLYSSPSMSMFNTTANNKRFLKKRTIDMECISNFLDNPQRTNSSASNLSNFNKNSLEVPEKQCKISFQEHPIDLGKSSIPDNKKEMPIKSIIQTSQNFNGSPLTKNYRKANYRKHRSSNITSSLIADDFNIEINNLDSQNYTTIDQILQPKSHHQNCKRSSDVPQHIFRRQRKFNNDSFNEIDTTNLHQAPSTSRKKSNKDLKNNSELEYESFTNRRDNPTTSSPRDSSCEPLIERGTEKIV